MNLVFSKEKKCCKNTNLQTNEQQCSVLGITKKGIRCKLQVTNGQYCHHHTWQDQNVPIVRDTHKPGFIYVYTYRHMYDSLLARNVADLNWLYVDDSILHSNGKRHHWSSNDSILCKIGMTTRSCVSTRLLEWQNSCKHPIVNLTPERVHSLCNQRKKSEKLTNMFSRLTLSQSKDPNQSFMPQLRTYRNGGFFADGEGMQTLAAIENRIHKRLWQRYGQGLIYCYGCDPEGNTRHKEWFRVPKKELPTIFRYIDSLCGA